MNNMVWIEVKRFIKNNYRKIILLALIFSVVYSLLQYFMVRNTDTAQLDEGNLTFPIEDTVPASFQFYVETEDGGIFTNTTLLEDYILLPRVIEEAEAATGVEISDVLEAQEEAGFEKAGEERGALGATRGTYSHVFTIIAKLGTPEENLAVANYFYEQVQAKEIPFFDNKNVYVLTTPSPVEQDEEAMEEERAAVQNERGLRSIIFDAAVGLIAGLIFSTLILAVHSLIQKKLWYSFSYNRSENDSFFYYDKKLGNKDEIVQGILHPFSDKKLLVTQNTLPEDLVQSLNAFTKVSNVNTGNNLDQSVEYTEDLGRVHPENTFEEIVLIIQSGNTDRSWYKKQRRLLKNYPSVIKVIQWNEK